MAKAFYTGLVSPPVVTPLGLARSFQRASDRANRANEKRYKQALREYRRLRSNMIAAANVQGDSQIADINQAFGEQSAAAMQSLAARGLLSSTVAPAMQSGIQRERLRALGRLRESLASQRAQADQMGTDRVVGIIQSRHDVGPDPAMLANMLQAYGASGAGSPLPLPPQFGPDPSMMMLQQLAQQQFQPMGQPMQQMGINRDALLARLARRDARIDRGIARRANNLLKTGIRANPRFGFGM